MKSFVKMVALSAGTLMIATIAAAGGNADVMRLAAAKRQLAAKANGQKGYPRARLDQERLRVANLIDELEAGKMIDPSEIDSTVRRANEIGR